MGLRAQKFSGLGNEILIINLIAEEEKFLLGLKIVRGAYHEQEIERAKEKGYACPVHTVKEDTDKYLFFYCISGFELQR